MKTSHWIGGMALLLLVAACAQSLREPQEAHAPTVEESAWITERLLTIKRKLPDYASTSDERLRWKLELCTTPQPDPYPVVETMDPYNHDSLLRAQQRLRQSASDDPETHGRALYRLFVRSKLDYARAGKITQPENQVIVKATYKPVPLDGALPHSDKQAALGADGKWYREGDADDLYILFRTDRKGIQTDAGWVYGIVSMDEDKVVAQGLLQNCMSCHRKNAPDRLFGMGE